MSDREFAFASLDAAQRLALTGRAQEAGEILAQIENFFVEEPGGLVTLYLATASVFTIIGDAYSAATYLQKAQQLQWNLEAEMGASAV
jgi:hypothetical protein